MKNLIVITVIAAIVLLTLAGIGEAALADQLRSGFVYAIIEDEVIILDSAGGGLDWRWVFEERDEFIELEEYGEIIFELKSSGDPKTILDDEVCRPTYSSTKVDREWADEIIAQYKRRKCW